MTIQVQLHISDDAGYSPAPPVCQWIESIAEQIVLDHQCSSGRLSIAILSDSEVRAINKQYLQHDYETDVISFNLSDDEDFVEGEIIISREMAERVAAEVNWPLESEILLYLIHGMLHVMGYDDELDEDRDEMRQQECYYLEKFQIAGWEKHPNRGEAYTDWSAHQATGGLTSETMNRSRDGSTDRFDPS